MELEELRARIRDWKARTQGAPPPSDLAPPDETYGDDVPVDEGTYDEAVAADGAEYVDDGIVAEAPIEGADAPVEVYDDAVPVEMEDVESASSVDVGEAVAPAEEANESALPQDVYESAQPAAEAAEAAETAARLGVDLEVPEGESTAEIAIPGEDGGDPQQGG